MIGSQSQPELNIPRPSGRRHRRRRLRLKQRQLLKEGLNKLLHHDCSGGLRRHGSNCRDIRKNKRNRTQRSKRRKIFYLTVYSQNAQSLKQCAKIDTIVDRMRRRRMDVYLVQETWLEGDDEYLKGDLGRSEAVTHLHAVSMKP